MKVHWTDRAKWRLRLINDHIAKEDPEAAKAVIQRLLKRSRQIGEHPYTGRQTPEYQRDDIRELLERPYRIIYCIKDTQIDVIAVMHYRQLLPSDRKEL